MSTKSSNGSLLSKGLMVLALGAIAAAALYAWSTQSDNSAELADAGSCTLSAEHRANIDKSATGEVAAFRVSDTPINLAGLKFNDSDGKAVTIADWNGRTVLLNLWATWCAPCRREMPSLDQLEADFGGEEFQVVPVSLDLGEPDKPKAFYEEIELKHLPFFHDGSLDTLNSLKKQNLAFGLPATILIDKRGCALGSLNGPAEWASEDAKRLVRSVSESG